MFSFKYEDEIDFDGICSVLFDHLKVNGLVNIRQLATISNDLVQTQWLENFDHDNDGFLTGNEFNSSLLNCFDQSPNIKLVLKLASLFKVFYTRMLNLSCYH